MAISVASLTASLNLDSGNFQSGLSHASGSLNKFASDAQSHAASAGGAFEGISAKAVALGGILSSVATGAIGALGSAFGSLKSGMIDGNAEFERYQTQFGVLLGSADAAKSRLEDLAKFGASTPFELPEVVRADKILQSFGLHAQDTAKKFGMSGSEIRTVAGDVAAGTGAKFEEIAGYLGKFSSGATGEAIARMQELGITTRAELTKMGLQFSKSGELVSPLDKSMAVLLQAMKSKFGGMMDAQSSTFEGMMSNLQDWTGQAMRLMGQPIFDALKGQLGSLLTVLNSGQVQAAITNIGSSIGSMVSGGISALQSLASTVGPVASQIGSALQGMMSGTTSIGAGTTNILAALGLDPGIAAQVGTITGSIASAIQSGIGRIQTAMQALQSGLSQGTPGAGVAGFLSALGLDDQLAGSIGAKVAEINTAIQTAKSNLGTAVQSFVAGWQQGTPGAAVAGFLSSMGVSDDIAGKIGSVVGGIAQAVQNAKTTLQTAIQGFQSGGLAGGATALLQSLGLDTSIVSQAQTVLSNIGSAIKDGVQRVKDAVSAAMSGGGVSGVLAALGLDPAIASQAQTLFNTVVSAVQSGLGRIKDAISAAVGGGGAAGVLRALGLSDETVGQIKSVIDRIGAVVGVLAQNFQSGFQQAAAALGPIMGPLKELATLVGGLVVGAFLGLVGFVAGAIPGIANVVAGVVKTVNGVLQFMAEFIKGVISIIANLIQGDWSGAWQAAVTMVANMSTRAQEIMNGLEQASFGIFQALVGGIISAFDGLYAAVTGEKLPSLVATVQAKFEELKTAAVTKVQELVDGAKAVFTQLVQGAQQIVSDVQAAFTSINWGEVGSNIVQGIANGIKSGAGWIADAARDAAKHALDAAKGFLGIQSPSKVMADEVGLPLAQGLAAGFAAGMDGAALVGVVAGIRSLMEQVGRVLKGVGDVVSMSDWEDLAGPVSKMADMFKALSEVGKTLAGDSLGVWAAAKGQIKGLIETARLVMTDLAPLLKGVGDKVSMSDWEDFAAPLKLLAESLSSIAGISGLFGDDKATPSLAGLGGRIRQLAVDARALLVDLDSAIAPVSALLPAKLKDLGDAAAGARSVADGALGLVKSLQEALTVDWAGINWPDAGRMMHDLAGMVLYFASKSEEAATALKAVDTSGLAPMKAAAESLIGIADGARGVVTRLVDALTVKWGAIDWPAAGKMMRDLTVMVAYFATKASEAAAGFKAVDTSGLAPLAQAAQATLDIATRTMDLVRAAVAALAFDWSTVSVNGIVGFVGWLVGLGVQLATAATTALGTWQAAVKPALADLGTVLGDTLGVLDNTFKLVAAVAVGNMAGMTGRDFLGQGPGGYSPIQNRLIWLVMVGQQLATAANDAMGTWTVAVKASLTNLGAVLKDSLSVLSDTFKIVETVAVGNMEGMTGRDFTPQGPGGYSAIQNRVLWVVLVGQKLAEAARDAMGTWSIDVPAALTPLKAVLSDALSILKDTLETVATLTGKDFPDLGDSVLAIVKARLSRLVVVGQELAAEANRVMTGWTLEVAPGFTALKGVLSDSLGIAKDALDLTGLLGGKDFPDLGDGVLAVLKTRLARLVFVGQELAGEANRVMTGWALTVAPGFAALKGVLSDSLSIAKDTLDTVGTLGGEKFPDLSAGVLDALKARLAALVGAGRDLAVAANTALGTWQMQVGPGWTALKGVLSDSLSVAKDTLDSVALLGADKFPDVAGSLSVVRTRLEELVRAGRDLAQAANTALGTWTMTVAPGWAALKSALGDSLGVVKDTLDFASLQVDLLAFRGFDMTRLGPKIDLLIQGAVAVARQFGEKAAQANIKAEWQKAGEALASVFGHAADSLTGALELGAKLLDPETQIPSIGQIDGKLTAILSLVQTVVQRFAEKAASVGPDTAKSAGGLADAVKSVFDAISQVIKAVQDAAGLYLGTSGFNNIAALLSYLFDTFDQFAGRAEGVNAVTAAITSLLGGLQALVSQAGTAAGTSWAQQFAAAITANAGLIQSAIQGALAPGNAGTGGGAVVSPGDERRFVPGNTATGTTVHQTVNVTLSTAAGLPATLEYLVNMARG